MPPGNVHPRGALRREPHCAVNHHRGNAHRHVDEPLNGGYVLERAATLLLACSRVETLLLEKERGLRRAAEDLQELQTTMYSWKDIIKALCHAVEQLPIDAIAVHQITTAIREFRADANRDARPHHVNFGE
eukprot:6741622-Pyramimonas_sp.AAC.1